MKKGKDLIRYKGHQITRKNHQVDAYIHYEYTVTGFLFDKPYKTFNLKDAKDAINKRL